MIPAFIKQKDMKFFISHVLMTNYIKNHFKLNNLLMSDNKMFDEKIFKIIEKDKKNVNKKINFILIKKIGSAFLSNNLNLDKIKKTLK